MSLTLVVLAAGMGSRFGGDKQLEPVGPNGELIIDYSIYDAAKAGFKKAVFVIRRELEERFSATIMKRASRFMECEYVFQELDQLPAGFPVPKRRTRPWGTAHAVLAAKNAAAGAPFAVINADDFYGRGAYTQIAGFLAPLTGSRQYCMAGYRLKNTISAHGSVNRGLCEIGPDGMVKSVNEVKGIWVSEADGLIRAGSGKSVLSPDAFVSMTCFGFTPDFFGELERGFADFLRDPATDKQKDELYLPSVVEAALKSGATMKLLPCGETWLGFTYKEDWAPVAEAIRGMAARGIYG